MSIKSYQRNVERGVAGPHLSTCFPAALEQMAENYSYRPQIYHDYISFCEWYNTLDEKGRREYVDYYEDIIEDLVRPLGGLALGDVVFKKIHKPGALAKHARELTSAGYSVVVEIRFGASLSVKEPIPHGVGLIPVQKDYYTLVSTSVPRVLQGVQPIEAIAERLLVTVDPSIPGHPMYTSNLTAVPIV